MSKPLPTCSECFDWCDNPLNRGRVTPENPRCPLLRGNPICARFKRNTSARRQWLAKLRGFYLRDSVFRSLTRLPLTSHKRKG